MYNKNTYVHLVSDNNKSSKLLIGTRQTTISKTSQL